MKEQPSAFGWSSVFRHYTFKCFIHDSAIPIIFATIICLLAYMAKADSLVILAKVLDLSINIVPAIIGLILAAYTILLSFFVSKIMQDIVATDKGKDFLQSLNSGFAFCLLMSAISILAAIVISCIKECNIAVNYANVCNYTAIWIVSYLMLFTVVILFGIIIDIFNSGQTAIVK